MSEFSYVDPIEDVALGTLTYEQRLELEPTLEEQLSILWNYDPYGNFDSGSIQNLPIFNVKKDPAGHADNMEQSLVRGNSPGLSDYESDIEQTLRGLSPSSKIKVRDPAAVWQMPPDPERVHLLLRSAKIQEQLRTQPQRRAERQAARQKWQRAQSTIRVNKEIEKKSHRERRLKAWADAFRRNEERRTRGERTPTPPLAKKEPKVFSLFDEDDEYLLSEDESEPDTGFEHLADHLANSMDSDLKRDSPMLRIDSIEKAEVQLINKEDSPEKDQVVPTNQIKNDVEEDRQENDAKMESNQETVPEIALNRDDVPTLDILSNSENVSVPDHSWGIAADEETEPAPELSQLSDSSVAENGKFDDVPFGLPLDPPPADMIIDFESDEEEDVGSTERVELPASESDASDEEEILESGMVVQGTADSSSNEEEILESGMVVQGTVGTAPSHENDGQTTSRDRASGGIVTERSPTLVPATSNEDDMDIDVEMDIESDSDSGGKQLATETPSVPTEKVKPQIPSLSSNLVPIPIPEDLQEEAGISRLPGKAKLTSARAPTPTSVPASTAGAVPTPIANHAATSTAQARKISPVDAGRSALHGSRQTPGAVERPNVTLRANVFDLSTNVAGNERRTAQQLSGRDNANKASTSNQADTLSAKSATPLGRTTHGKGSDTSTTKHEKTQPAEGSVPKADAGSNDTHTSISAASSNTPKAVRPGTSGLAAQQTKTPPIKAAVDPKQLRKTDSSMSDVTAGTQSRGNLFAMGRASSQPRKTPPLKGNVFNQKSRNTGAPPAVAVSTPTSQSKPTSLSATEPTTSTTTLPARSGSGGHQDRINLLSTLPVQGTPIKTPKVAPGPSNSSKAPLTFSRAPAEAAGQRRAGVGTVEKRVWPVTEQASQPSKFKPVTWNPTPTPKRPPIDLQHLSQSSSKKPKTQPKPIPARKRSPPRKKPIRRKRAISAQDNIFEVEEILEVDERVVEGADGRLRPMRYYHIAWKGFPDPSENTWEPEENVLAPAVLEEFWGKQKKPVPKPFT